MGPAVKRYIWQAIWFWRRRMKGSRKIRGLVLDVGSGNAPHPRADVLAEKYLADDTNRIGGQKMLAVAPTVACDAEALPFADDTFDYVVCSHLIEHVDRPDRVLSELSRVGKAGYIECPRQEYDKLDSPWYHRWFAKVEDGTLVLKQKDRAEFDPAVNDLVREAFYPANAFWSIFWRRLDKFFVMMPWEGRIPFRVEYLPLEDGSPGSAERSLFDDPRWLESRGFAVVAAGRASDSLPVRPGVGQLLQGRLWKALRWWARRGARDVDVTEIVVCPADGHALDAATDRGSRGASLVCAACGTAYPVAGDIPFIYPGGGGPEG